MKTRSDFVTNSSSTCFILAKADSCTEHELMELLHGLKNEIIRCRNDFNEDTSPEALEEFIHDLIDHLLNKFSYDLELDRWKTALACYGDEYSSIDYFMQCHGHMIQTENFKVGPT